MDEQPVSHQSLTGELEQSRIAGEYYRDLSANYLFYEETNTWPNHPFPHLQYTHSSPVVNPLDI